MPIGERHGVGPLDRVFSEITVRSCFMDLDRSLPWPVMDFDAGLDGLVCVIVPQGDLRSLNQPRQRSEVALGMRIIGSLC